MCVDYIMIFPGIHHVCFSKEQSTVAKFLVKFDSESEAWRCVRTFHNTDFLLKSRQENYRLQLSVAY